MSDYISREATYQSLTEYYHHTTEGMHSALREAINRVPAADVRPVVRGKWRPHKTKTGKNWWKCSACDYVSEHKAHHNYCPNCGANMREPPKEET